MNGKLTHLALPCHDLEKTIQWYERFTPLKVIHHREDSGAKVAWIQADDKSIFLVFLQSPDSKEPKPILSPFAHLESNWNLKKKSMQSLKKDDIMHVWHGNLDKNPTLSAMSVP